MANVCDSYCKGCVYKGYVNGHVPCCHYIFVVGKPRPCPPGKGCTVKKEGRYKKTVDELRADKARRAGEYRLKHREQMTVKCICGVEFITTDPHRKYCSRHCYKEAKRQRERKVKDG